jgi:hypothetical protein
MVSQRNPIRIGLKLTLLHAISKDNQWGINIKVNILKHFSFPSLFFGAMLPGSSIFSQAAR